MRNFRMHWATRQGPVPFLRMLRILGLADFASALGRPLGRLSCGIFKCEGSRGARNTYGYRRYIVNGLPRVVLEASANLVAVLRDLHNIKITGRNSSKNNNYKKKITEEDGSDDDRQQQQQEQQQEKK